MHHQAIANCGSFEAPHFWLSVSLGGESCSPTDLWCKDLPALIVTAQTGSTTQDVPHRVRNLLLALVGYPEPA